MYVLGYFCLADLSTFISIYLYFTLLVVQSTFLFIYLYMVYINYMQTYVILRSSTCTEPQALHRAQNWFRLPTCSFGERKVFGRWGLVTWFSASESGPVQTPYWWLWSRKRKEEDEQNEYFYRRFLWHEETIAEAWEHFPQ